MILTQICLQELEDLKRVFEDPNSEPELVKLAKEEAKKCHSAIQQLEEQILSQIVPKEETDEGAAILEIRAGRARNTKKTFQSLQMRNRVRVM
jgi:protein subunit release factor A